MMNSRNDLERLTMLLAFSAMVIAAAVAVVFIVTR